MNAFFKNLDRAAERFINIMDSQLQETTVQAVTGKVFTHDLATQPCTLEDETLPQATPVTAPAPRSTREPRKTDTGAYPPVLRKARASHK